MNIKQYTIVLLVAGILFGNAFTVSAQTVMPTSVTALQELIQTLQKQVENLIAQLQTSQKTQTQPQAATTITEGVDALQLIGQLKEGSSGEQVILLQSILAKDVNIYPEGIVTGYYGRLTAQAVARYKKLHETEQLKGGEQTAVQPLKNNKVQVAKPSEHIWQPNSEEVLNTDGLKAFLALPTPDAFRKLCVESKLVNIPGSVSGQKLNDDKTQLVDIPGTLYDAMQCRLVMEDGFIIAPAHRDLFQWKLENGDSDTLRVKKINYNRGIDQINATYKLVIYRPETASLIDSTGAIKTADLGSLVEIGLVLPEKIVQNIVAYPNLQNIRRLIDRNAHYRADFRGVIEPKEW